jgi:hypothetical protein
MGDVYIPGIWSQRYRNLPAPVRAAVDQEVNTRFKQRTGVSRSLDPKRDHDLVNRWLRIRDEVMEQTGGNIRPDPVTPPKPPCPNDFGKSFEIEAREASRTRHQAIDVASRFFRTVGAVGRTGRFIPTIIDTKFWFAKLYEITTGFEISAARDYKEPGFVLHFIPIFYNMYNQALDSWGAGGGGAVSPLWRVHFMSTGRPDTDSIWSWSNGVVTSLVTGVNAHIRGDMGQALETAYRSFVKKYCLDPAPPFDTYKEDFFAMGTVFNQARAAAMSLVASLGPIPEAGVKVGDALGAGLDVGQVNQWRAEAWAEGKRRLGQ